MTRAERTANSRDRNTRNETSKVVQSERGAAGEESDEMSARDRFMKAGSLFNKLLDNSDLDHDDVTRFKEMDFNDREDSDFGELLTQLKTDIDRLKSGEKPQGLGVADNDIMNMSDEDFEKMEKSNGIV